MDIHTEHILYCVKNIRPQLVYTNIIARQCFYKSDMMTVYNTIECTTSQEEALASRQDKVILGTDLVQFHAKQPRKFGPEPIDPILFSLFTTLFFIPIRSHQQLRSE